MPYPHNRSAIADLVAADEADLWPDAGGLLAARMRPDELGTVYPHRWAVPREVWARLFGSADREIAILAYSALFLAEDAGILRILAEKGRAGVNVRIALGDPDGPQVAARGEEEGIGDAMAAKIRNALTLYGPLCAVETPRYGSTVPCCTTRSTVPTTSYWSISTPMAPQPRRHPCSASTPQAAERW